jgi:D-glycero-alpha-D-manno-heptose-7-phosphate kinase
MDMLSGPSSRFPENLRILATVPTRINCGGTWDIPALALPFEKIAPTTVNIAIAPKIEVRLAPYKSGLIHIKSSDLGEDEFQISNMPFEGPLGLVLAITNFYGIHGVDINITNHAPIKSGLGGSSSLSVALISAFDQIDQDESSHARSKRQVAYLSHVLENNLGFSITGMQDQLAAVYGGVHQWLWNYSSPDRIYKKIRLLSNAEAPKIEGNILIGYIGQTHNSSDLNRQWIEHFKKGIDREKWISINQNTHNFAKAIQNKDWIGAGWHLANETKIRLEISSEMVPSKALGLINSALENGCGARFAGAGGGGCVWSIGPSDKINALRGEWDRMLSSIGGKLLPFKVSANGVSVMADYQKE